MKRTIVITGGTKGLGREMALAFGRAGYCVVALYSADAAAASQLEEAMALANMSGVAVRHDVCSEDTSLWERPEIQTADNLALVNNACAAFAPAPLHQFAWAEFEKNFLVAVKGAWSCSRSIMRPMLKKGGGAIVNVLTSAVNGPPPKGFAPYLTAKYALHGFTLALASEYSPRGIKIFSVSPGFMDTPLTSQWDDRLRETIRAHSPRVTQPEKAARRIVDLLQSGEVPGQGEDYPL